MLKSGNSSLHLKADKQFLYFGVWNHFDPIIHFPDCKTFIFIDTQPRTEWDFSPNTFDTDVYRRNFINVIKSDLNNLGFNLIEYRCLDYNYIKNISSHKFDFDTKKSYIERKYIQPIELNNIINSYPFINPHLFVFYNEQNKQTIKYYVSTNIKYTMTNELKSDIESSTVLVCAGFAPDIELLQYIIKPINFYGYTGTVYDSEDYYDNNTLFKWLHDFKNNSIILNNYFSSFNVVNKKTGEIIPTNSYNEFIELVDFIYRQNKNMFLDNVVLVDK
jgi:hypothetical protein